MLFKSRCNILIDRVENWGARVVLVPPGQRKEGLSDEYDK